MDAKKGMVWSYDFADGWKRINDPLRPAGASGDYDRILRDAGYLQLGEWPHSDAAFWVEVFEHGDDEKFLVCVNTQCRWHPVFVAGVPSLLALLKEMLPVVESTDRLSEANERHEDELERRRQQRRRAGASA